MDETTEGARTAVAEIVDRMHHPRPWGTWVPALAGCAALAAGVALLFAPPAASAATTGHHAGSSHQAVKAAGPEVTVRNVGGLGAVLVDRQGRTLYVTTADGSGRSTCTGSCAKTWPPYLLPKGVTRVAATKAVTGLGTVRRPGGRLQLTARHRPLYRYAGDQRAGQATGEGLEGTWFAATPNGRHPAGAAGATGPANGTTTTPSTSAPGQAPSSSPTTAPVTGGRSTATSPPSSTATSPGATTTAPARSATTTPSTAPPPTSPPATSPPTTPPTSQPATSPPPTSPPPTSPPTTTPPPPPTTTTTTPAGGGVAY